MSYDQAAVNALLNAAKAHAEATGAFRSVVAHEPKSAPGTGLRAAMWVQRIRPTTASGLSATSGVVTLNVRVYLGMLTKPEDDIDPQVLAALSMMMDQYSGDFTFGGTIRNVDLLGMYGESLEADMGYLTIGDTVYRVGTLVVPCVINDLWVQGGIPSAEETPGRSLQVDSLGVTGGASIGGALTVGGGAAVTGDTSVGGGLTVTDAVSAGGLLSASGGVTISDVPGPSGPHPFGYGNSEALTGLQIVSSYPSDDVSGGTDGTGRITLYSYQRANVYSFGETIRNFLMRWDAKAMTAWYGPTGGTSGALTAAYDVNGNATGTNYKPWTWVGSHYEANDHASIHGHWEVEIPDATGALQGRFSIQFADLVSGAIGLDKTNIVTNIADFTFQAQGLDHTGASQEQYFRISAPAGHEKPFEFNNASTLANVAAGVRWRVVSNSTAESGSNAGSDLVIRNYTDSGSFLSSALFIQRSDGQIATGNGGPLGARIAVAWGTSGIAGFYAKATSSPGSAAAFYSELTATSDRLLQAILIGDTNNRFITQASGTMLWGPGNATQDTNLYRGGANLLKTDDSFQAAAVAIGTAPGSLSLSIAQSSSGQLAQFTRTSTSDTSPVVLVLAGDTSTAQAIGVSVNGDGVSRLGIDPTGKITWGDGTNARDVDLYRASAGILKTDQSLTVQGTLGIGQAAGASIKLGVSNSAAGQLAQFTRTSTSDTSPVVVILAGDTSTAQALGISVSGDATDRFGVDPAGKITWGSGAASRDTNLYRSAAGALVTDGGLLVGGTSGMSLGAAQPEDLGLIGWAYDVATPGGSSTALGTTGTAAAGVLQLIKVPVRVTKSCTGVRLYLGTLGSGLTSTENFVGVYSSAGSEIGTSADQTTAWNTGGTTGVVDAALVSGPFTVSPPFVWVAVLYNGTTGPSFLRSGNLTGAMANGKLSAATSRYGSIGSSNTALPGSFTPSSITQLACEFWAALY